MEKEKSKSELRQDIVSGDWILLSTARAKRPMELIEKVAKKEKISEKDCPFENLLEEKDTNKSLIYPNSHSWAVVVLDNKYPAVRHADVCGVPNSHGPYSVMEANGHHDLIVTKEHDKNFPQLDRERAVLVFQAFRDRYLMLNNDKCIDYVSIFHNWGPGAGASIYHPHYQLIAIPVVPPDVAHSLIGSKRYFDLHQKCAHCVMLDFELSEKTRVIYENEGAVAFAPFVSRSPFEIRVFPKKHLSYFENTHDVDIEFVVDALQKSLGLIEENLNSPDYNFFIHTSPVKNKLDYQHYHWHIEVVPKISIRAGFELGTGLEINVVDPDEAASILRK